jgi:hypothetical protein
MYCVLLLLMNHDFFSLRLFIYRTFDQDFIRGLTYLDLRLLLLPHKCAQHMLFNMPLFSQGFKAKSCPSTPRFLITGTGGLLPF